MLGVHKFMEKKRKLDSDVMQEIKEAHANGTYLEKVPQEDIDRRNKEKKGSLRSQVIKELKEIIPSHTHGTFLDKPNQKELERRALEKSKRVEELKEVERVLKKTCQVKFLVNTPELAKLKKFVEVSHQTQSEFIRTAIWDKIRSLEGYGKLESSDTQEKKKQEDKLRLEELKKIRKALAKLEKTDKKR